MLTRILATGVLAGVLAGCLTALLQHATTTRLILAAERHLAGAREADAERGVAAHAGHGAAHKPAGAAAGLQRTARTTLATIGVAVAFALLLLAAMTAQGAEITPRTALLWGMGGFIATGFGPALELPPELPGTLATEAPRALMLRQAWWVATVAATAGGVWLLATARARAVAVALILLPHLAGAPQSEESAALFPPGIASRFTAASLIVHAVLWALVGALSGYFWQRQRKFAAVRP
jgi:cobalt transporter subunit CbtA